MRKLFENNLKPRNEIELKETVRVISSHPPRKDGNARFNLIKNVEETVGFLYKSDSF